MTDRAVAMAASLRTAAARMGVGSEAIGRLDRVHALAMKPRLELLDDDHHPAYLHPGRSALILIRDAGVADVPTLALAAALESRDDVLRVPAADYAGLAEELPAIIESIPFPGDEALAERLVTLDDGPRLAALAERLDHLRHEHVYLEHAAGETEDTRGRWVALHDEVGAVWLPVAQRTHVTIARRYAHWHRTFARRLRS